MSREGKETFGAADYAVFILVLLVSAGIGVFYAIKDRKRTNTKEFLLAGRSMGVVPVSLSVLATAMSAVTLLGTPQEIYRYGTQYAMITIAFIFIMPATAYLYLPVYYNLGLTSVYQYLELRFHRYLRPVGSAVFIFHMLMYMPVVLYAPALALAEVTGFKVWTSVLSIGLVCTFYTSIGGMKAVVWTDAFQAIMMYSSILIVLIKGAVDLGGIDIVWERALEGERIEFFKFDVDPFVRHTFWTMTIGGYITWMGTYAANQSLVQRYLTVASLAGAQACLWINVIFMIVLIISTSLCGMVIYAYYATCDPIGTKTIDSADQLFPRFVMDTLQTLPGLPGLFVSGIFSGALSTVSSGVNSLSAVTLEDFVKTYFVKDMSEVVATRVTKGLAVGYGLLAILLVVVAQQLGGVLQAALTIHGVIGGPMLGVFTLGMFLPFANTWGASSGLFSGLVIAMWFGMGSFAVKPYTPEAPMNYDSCPDLYFNATGIDITNNTDTTWIERNNDDVFLPYRLSYLWMSSVGYIVTLIVGIIISLVTGASKGKEVDENLLSPIVLLIRKHLPGGRNKKLTLNETKTTASLSTLDTSFGGSEPDLASKAPVSYIGDNTMYKYKL